MRNAPPRALVTPPGELLKEELEARGWTQRGLAEIIGRPEQVVSAIIRGKKAITPATSFELGEALGTSPGFWFRLDALYRLHLARKRFRKTAIPRRRAAYEARLRGEREAEVEA